jgi:hypothetical protein
MVGKSQSYQFWHRSCLQCFVSTSTTMTIFCKQFIWAKNYRNQVSQCLCGLDTLELYKHILFSWLLILLKLQISNAHHCSRTVVLYCGLLRLRLWPRKAIDWSLTESRPSSNGCCRSWWIHGIRKTPWFDGKRVGAFIGYMITFRCLVDILDGVLNFREDSTGWWRTKRRWINSNLPYF